LAQRAPISRTATHRAQEPTLRRTTPNPGPRRPRSAAAPRIARWILVLRARVPTPHTTSNLHLRRLLPSPLTTSHPRRSAPRHASISTAHTQQRLRPRSRARGPTHLHTKPSRHRSPFPRARRKPRRERTRPRDVWISGRCVSWSVFVCVCVYGIALVLCVQGETERQTDRPQASQCVWVGGWCVGVAQIFMSEHNAGLYNK
jgi:hypothetical protein